ncbi:MAG: serine/threonine-protein kinase [Planctomycetota bacterium]
MTQIAVGQWLDSWVVEAPLGEGAFSKVFRGRHSGHQHSAALKVPTDPRYTEQLRIDARALQLEHPHVVRAQELHLEHEPPFVVLDLVEGGSLREAMTQEHLSWERVSKLVDQCAAALDHAHERGVLHLDLKPENVLLDANGDVRVTDFGLVPPGSREVLSQSLLLSEELGVVGTHDYAAPELRAADGVLDRRADVYALGVVAFELLTGRLPIGLDRPSQLRPDLPAGVDDVLGGALARDPARRPAAAGAFAASLRTALQVTPSEEPTAPPRRSGALLGAASAALALVLIAAVTLFGSAPERSSGWSASTLWADVPPTEALTLLPVEPAGERERPAARALRAALDRALARDGREVLHPQAHDADFHLADLADPARRRAVIERAHSPWAILAAPHGGAEPSTAFCALLDLEHLTLRAARPTEDEVALRLSERIGAKLTALGPGPVWVEPAVDAELGVSNEVTSAFASELSCGLVKSLGQGHPVLADLGPGAPEPPGAKYRVLVQLSAKAGAAKAELQDVLSGASQHVDVVWSAPVDYDPTASARELTRDPERLATLEARIDAALSAALAEAHDALESGQADEAVRGLSAVREQGQAYASRIELRVALADARRAAGDLQGCLADYRATLALDPSRDDVRARYASVCLEEAQALYAAGKGRWYQNDDEDKFSEALELLELTRGLSLDPALREQLDALTADVRREL